VLMLSGRAVAQKIAEGQWASFTNETLGCIGRGTILVLPFPIYLPAAVWSLVTDVGRRTAIGMLIGSVAIRPRASYDAGINARLIKLLVYILSGVLAALAGLIVAGEVKSADPHKAGEWAELDAILAVVIGGTALTGGRFNLVQTTLGVLIIQSLLTALHVSKLHPTANLVVKAIVVLAVLLLQSEEFRHS